MSVALDDADGLLSANTDATGGGGTISGSGTRDLTIVGALGQINADLTTLSYQGAALGSDNLVVSANDGLGGVTDAEVAMAVVSCYCPGTLILTARGEVAVERLAVGDLVVTASGHKKPIQWIGHRDVDCARHPEPEKVWPVRIAAGAIGPGMPASELVVSAEHSLFFDDILVPARLFVNGSTVLQEPVESVSYWHVELDSHDLLIAEGVAAESYLDCGNRKEFANAGPVVSLHPDFAREGKGADAIWAERACAPRCLDGPRLTRLRKWRAGRAEFLGARTTADPRLQVLADGEVLTPVSVVDRCFRFDVPHWATSLRLRSRSAFPARLHDGASTDTRRLGVSPWKLEVDGQDTSLADPRLSDGWHEVEGEPPRQWRWSNGDAALPLGRTLALWIETLAAYPLPPPVPRREPSLPKRMARLA
jgi:hypothetical protein